MVQEELKKIDGVSLEQIPVLVRTLGPILMQESEAKRAQHVLGANRPPGPLTEVEIAKVEYLTDVSSVLHQSAVDLINGWTNLGWQFEDVAAALPAHYASAPDLLERFRILTPKKSQQNVISKLATAVRTITPYITSSAVSSQQSAIWYGIGDLIARKQLPKANLAYRDFINFACMGLGLDSDTFQVPKVVGPPRLQSTSARPSASLASPAASKEPITSVTPPAASARAASKSTASITPKGASAASSASKPPVSTSNLFSSTIAASPSAVHPSTSSDMALSSSAGFALPLDRLGDPATTPLSSAPSTAHYAPPPPSSGPSYTQRPSTYEPPTCSSRDALGDSVLNDYFHCAGAGSEGSSPQMHDYIRNNAQEALFRLEEDALCLDILIGRAQSTIRVLAEISNRLSLLSRHGSVTFTSVWGRQANYRSAQDIITSSLMPTHIETFKTIIKTRTTMPVDPVVHFVGDPQRFILDMTRLIMFHADEHGRARQAFGKLWRQAFAKNYLPSLDHRVYRMKFDDKYMVNAKAVLASMNSRFMELLSSGREWSADFLECLDFTHYRYNVLPALGSTKSDRYRQEHPRKKKKTDPLESNSIPEDILVRFEEDIISLLKVGGERLLHKSEVAEMSTWLEETFSTMITRPIWDSQSPRIPNIFYNLPQFAVCVKMFHTLHERIRLAFYLANTFDGHCWDFASASRPEVPKKKSIPEVSKFFPLFDTAAGDAAAPVVADEFDLNPPTPLLELSTFFHDTNPHYIQQWEGETIGPGQRLTRSGAQTSTSILLGGPPPLSNTHLTNTLLRQAATLRNTPWPSNPFSSNPVETESGDHFDVNDTSPASLPPLADPAFAVDNAKRYEIFIQLVSDVLNGKLTSSAYDAAVLKLLGIEAYPLYSLHRLITNLVAAIRTMMTIPGRQVWYQIWADHRRRILSDLPTSAEAIEEALKEYRDAAHEAAGDRKFAEFYVSPSGSITYQFRQIARQSHSTRSNGRGPHPHKDKSTLTWENYVNNWNSSRADCVRLSKRRVFLQRNIASQIPEEVRSEPLTGRAHSWALAQSLSTLREKRNIVQSTTLVFATIDPESYRFLLDPETPDIWSLSKHRKSVQTRPKASPKSPNTRLHRQVRQLAQALENADKKKDMAKRQKDQKWSAQQSLSIVESILASELERADHEDVIEPIESFETVSSRTRGAVPNGNAMDADSDAVSAASYQDDSESEGEGADNNTAEEPEGSSLADDESVRMQVD